MMEKIYTIEVIEREIEKLTKQTEVIYTLNEMEVFKERTKKINDVHITEMENVIKILKGLAEGM